MVFNHWGDDRNKRHHRYRDGPLGGCRHRIERHGRGFGQPASPWYRGPPRRAEPAGRPPPWEAARPWHVPGPFTGVGPQAYLRNPMSILEDVVERLTWHGLIDATRIQVECTVDGSVTLRGEVRTRREKYRAEDVAASVSGVSDVQNRLRPWDARPASPQAGRSQWYRRVRAGMQVEGREGRHLGRVGAADEYDFRVDDHGRTSFYVPYSAIQAILGETVTLQLLSSELGPVRMAGSDDQGG